MRRIFHLSLPVSDLEAARRFYQRYLGATLGRTEDDWIDVLLWGHQITLQHRPDEVLPSAAQGKRHFGAVLPWNEWEALAAHLESLGADFIEPPAVLHASTPEEQAKLYLEDPSHNVIEIKAYRDFPRVLGTGDASLRRGPGVTLFEYLSIAYSLIFSFAVIRIVGGLRHVFDWNRLYAVHASSVCFVLFGVLALFWAHWSTRDLDWTFPAFLMNLLGPATFYFAASVIVPDEPASVESWRNYYYSVRVPFYSGICAYAVIMFSNTTLLLGLPLLHPMRGVQAGILTIGIVGLSTARPGVHRMLMLSTVIIMLGVVTVLLRPGSLAA